MAASIMVTITAIYTPKDGINMDEAVRVVSVNLEQIMRFAKIENGKQLRKQKSSGMPIFCPPPLDHFVELQLVKPLIVVSPDTKDGHDA